jgi:hypothetical protein
LWVHYTNTPIPVPLGVYDHASTTIGVTSVPVERSAAAKILRGITRVANQLEDAAPGSKGLFAWLFPDGE